MSKEFTAYLGVPKRFCNGLTLEFDPDLEPVILTEGITDPDKVYEIVSLEKPFRNWNVGDRFTGRSFTITGNGSVFEVTTGFVFKRKDIPGKVIAEATANLNIVHVHFKRHFIKAIKRLSESEELDNSSLAAAKLTNAYIGKTRQSVFNMYPALEGGTTDGEGNYTLNLPLHQWGSIVNS